MKTHFSAHAVRRWWFLFLLGVSVLLFGGCYRSNRETEQLRRDIEELTGAHTRIVWVQDSHERTDVFARGNQLRLMGYDSQDGRGERVILPGPDNFAKPLLLDDGETILFSHYLDGYVYSVDWEGAEVTQLIKGRALDVWRDGNGVDWVFIGTEPAESDAPAYHRVTRHRIDNPNIAEHVWEGQPVGEDSFQLSADGRVAAGNFPWPECGIMHIPEQRIEILGRGCWTSLAPDNSYRFWIFDGSHRNLLLFDTVTGERTTIPISQAPGINNHEVYHPRWSNDPRIMVMSGPYKIRHGGNNIRGGGEAVEIHVGRFDAEFSAIESWAQVTSNAYANFFPDVWVAGTQEAEPSDRVADATMSDDSHVMEWPLSEEALLYRWEHAGAQNEIVDDETGRRIVFRPEARGRARYGWQQAMWVDQGYFVDDQVALSGSTWSLEFVVQGLAPNTELLHIGDALSIAVLNESWILRVGAEQYELGSTAMQELLHVSLVANQDTVTLFFNGERVSRIDLADVILLPESVRLFFGGHPDYSIMGPALLSHIGIYACALQEIEISQHASHLLNKITSSPPPEIERLRGRVVKASSVPEPADIAPYTRALIFHEYEVVEGPREGDRLLAAHWGILGAKVLSEAERPVDSIHDLQLVRFDDRPELEGERVAMDQENFLLDWYYDLTL